MAMDEATKKRVRLALGLEIGARVVIGRIQSRMAEPAADHGHVDTGGGARCSPDGAVPGPSSTGGSRPLSCCFTHAKLTKPSQHFADRHESFH
jgi:hypothetical protein